MVDTVSGWADAAILVDTSLHWLPSSTLAWSGWERPGRPSRCSLSLMGGGPPSLRLALVKELHGVPMWWPTIAPDWSHLMALAWTGLAKISTGCGTKLLGSSSIGGRHHRSVSARMALVTPAVPAKLSRNHDLVRSGWSGTLSQVVQGMRGWRSDLTGCSATGLGGLASSS